MNSREEDNLSMEILVEKFITRTDPTTLAQMPGMGALNTKFGANINLLRACKNGQVLNRTGNRMSKEALREEMTQKGFTVAADVCSYAIEIEDEVLQMSVTYVESDLNQMRDTDVADACTSIFDIATLHVANLADYGTTPAILDELKDIIALYNEVLPDSRAGIVTQTTFTERIKQLFEENRKIIFRMDKLVTRLKFREADYYDEYFKSRKIIDTGSRKFSLRGKVLNELGQPVDKVAITVELPQEVTRKSTALGNFQFKGIPAGVWPVTFKRDGFDTIREFVVFTPTLRVELNVTLKVADLQQRSA